MLKSNKFTVTCIFSFILLFSEYIYANSISDKIEDSAKLIHDARKNINVKLGNSTTVIQNIYDMMTGAKTNSIDFNRSASDKEREQAIYAIHESVALHGKGCFAQIEDSKSTHKNYTNHIETIHIWTSMAYVMHKNPTSCLWSNDDLAEQVAKRYVKFLNKIYGSSINKNNSRGQTLIDNFNGLADKKSYIVRFIHKSFQPRFIHSHKEMPDVNYQYLLKTADTIKSNLLLDNSDNYKMIERKNFKIFGVYVNKEFKPLCVQKPKDTANSSRKDRSRQWQNEVLCTKLARKLQFDDAMSPVDQYGDYTYEPFIGALGRNDLEHCNNEKLQNEFVKNYNKVLYLSEKGNTSSGNYVNVEKINKSKLQETYRTLRPISHFLLEQSAYIADGHLNDDDKKSMQSCNDYLIKNIDFASLQKILILSYITMHLDFHAENIMISLNKDGKFFFTAIDFEYSLARDLSNASINKFRKNGLAWLVPSNLTFNSEIVRKLNSISMDKIQNFVKKHDKLSSAQQRIKEVKDKIKNNTFVGQTFTSLFNENSYKESSIGKEYLNLFDKRYNPIDPVNLLYEHFTYQNDVNMMQVRQPDGTLTIPIVITRKKLQELRSSPKNSHYYPHGENFLQS